MGFKERASSPQARSLPARAVEEDSYAVEDLTAEMAALGLPAAFGGVKVCQC
jgi:hypothetical protein